MNSADHSRRRAVVTGGTKGIGRAVVERFAADGWEVLATARGEHGLAELAQTAPGAIRTLAADGSTPEGIAATVARVQDLWGAVDVVVNNIGTNVRKPSTEYTPDEIDAVLNTNLRSALDFTRAIHPLLLEGDAPAIVTVSSVAGLVHVGSGVVYAMTKAALDQMTRYLACEWAPTPDRRGVRVNAVLPWYIATPLAAPVLSDPDRLARILAVTPMARVGQPDEVAAAVRFLAGRDASYITGQCLAVDGGMLALGMRTAP